VQYIKGIETGGRGEGCGDRMAIIIGDIHGNLAAAKAFLAYRAAEVHIALGDLVDSRADISPEEEFACLELLLASDSLFVWGNHDLAYLPERPWRPYGRSQESFFRDLYHQHRHRFSAALAIDGWLLTHAGVAPQLARIMPPEIAGGGVEGAAGWLNQEFEKQIQKQVPGIVGGSRYGHGPLFQIAFCRGGQAHYGGIFWFDESGEQSQPAPAWPQIFGHTPVPTPQRGKGVVIREGKVADGAAWINLNAEAGIWVYDTDTDEIAEIR